MAMGKSPEKTLGYLQIPNLEISLILGWFSASVAKCNMCGPLSREIKGGIVSLVTGLL
jgi:hypothetical protein